MGVRIDFRQIALCPLSWWRRASSGLLALVVRARLGQQLANDVLLFLVEFDAGVTSADPHDAAIDFDRLIRGKQKTHARRRTDRAIAIAILSLAK